jgi:hypothetical protein
VFNKYLVDINKKQPNFEIHHLEKSKVNGLFDLEAEKKLLESAHLAVPYILVQLPRKFARLARPSHEPYRL